MPSSLDDDRPSEPPEPSGAAGGGPSEGAPPPPRPTSRRRTLLLIGLAVLAALLIGRLATQLRAGKPRAPPPPAAVGIAIATRGDVPVVLDGLGTVQPATNVTVRTRIAGTLERLAFREGQMVRAGQLLALVDCRPYVVALKQAQGQLQRDEALLRNSRVDLERYRTLLVQDSIASQQVDTQVALVAQNEGTVAADRAAVAAARLNVTYCRIEAPSSGRVGLNQVDPGNYVQTSDPNGIVVLTQVEPIDVVFTLPENAVPRVQARLRQTPPPRVTALDPARTTTLAEGVLEALDNVIDPTTGTIKAKAGFANRDGALFPNQFVNVRLPVETLRGVVVVPGAAIRHGAPGDFVYVVTADRTAHVRKVTPGPADGDRVAVLKGLAPGETAVIAGADRLREGAKVALPGDRPARAAGAGRPSGGGGG